jgi:cyanophycinase-like exopeptidase
MQTALSDPSQAEVDALHAHFCTQDVDIAMDDSGLVNRRDAYEPGVVRRLETADLVLITGGSPERLYDCTVDTPALNALRVASDRGAVIAGCSAGAIVVGAGMPVGAADDRRPGRFWELIRRTVVAPHFGRYDIKPWLRSFPECVVLGIPDDTMALVVHGRKVRSVGGQPLYLASCSG